MKEKEILVVSEEPKLIKICAWCYPELPPLLMGMSVTHGICEKHKKEFLERR